MPESLRELVEAEKKFAEVSEWSLVGQRLELKLPLEIDGVVEEQFFVLCKLSK